MNQILYFDDTLSTGPKKTFSAVPIPSCRYHTKKVILYEAMVSGGFFFVCRWDYSYIHQKKRKNTLFALFSHLILYLVGGFNHLEKYELVSWDYDIPNWMESHKIPWFQSPPTRYSTSWKTVSHSYGLDDPQPGDYPYLNCPMIIPWSSIPSGKQTVRELENGHRNRWFTH